MERVRAEWACRVEAEYRSAAWSAELLTLLLRAALSPDTLSLAHRVVSDELAHAAMAREVLLAAGGDPTARPLARAGLHLPQDPTLPEELRLLRAAADLFCCGETVAVPLFSALREGAEEPLAVAALDRVLEDEPHHSALGWFILDELLERLGEPARAWLAPHTREGLARVRRAYTVEGPDVTPAQRRWGLMGPATYAQVCEEAIRSRVIPGFVRRGLI